MSLVNNAIHLGGTSLTGVKTWKSSVNLPRSNLEMVCTTELNNAAISAFLKSIAHQYCPATVKTAFCAIRVLKSEKCSCCRAPMGHKHRTGSTFEKFVILRVANPPPADNEHSATEMSGEIEEILR
jgi:hypothetical protein